MIVSFAWTAPALLRGEKWVTSREWTDSYLERWQRAWERGDRRHQAYDKSPHRGGRQVGWIDLTDRPARVPFADFTMDDIRGGAGPGPPRGANPLPFRTAGGGRRTAARRNWRCDRRGVDGSQGGGPPGKAKARAVRVLVNDQ